MSGLNKIAARELAPLGYPNTCLKTVGLRRMLQYAENNFDVQWLNRATVAHINSLSPSDPRYKKDFLLSTSKQ